MPPVASWYSIQRPTDPPLPFNPFPDLPVFALEPGRFAFDDRTVNYVEIQRQIETERGIMDSLTPPPIANPVPLDAGIESFRAKLDRPSFTGPRTKLHMTFPPDFLPDPLLWWDVYFTPDLNAGFTWELYWSGSPGQSEFEVPTPPSETGFWLVAWGTDTRDDDGLPDGFEELTVSTDNLLLDSDGDGLRDAWEVHYGLDPNDSTGFQGANGNPDSDARTNIQELAAEKDPMDAEEDRPRVWIEAIDGVAMEPSNTALFRVHRERAPLNQALQVMFTLGGKAKHGPSNDPETDYTLATVTGTYPALAVAIPPGSASVDLTISPKSDARVEGGESVIVALSRDLDHYTIDWTRGRADAVIHDGNVLIPSLDAGLKVGVLKEGSSLKPEGAPTGTPIGLKYVAVACTGRNTVARIDAGSGAILGEYRALPERIAGNPPSSGLDGSPSRTTVDPFGNIWVGNRNDVHSIGGGEFGSATRIGLLVPGPQTRRYRKTDDGGFVEDSQGQYFRDPFAHNTCPDRDGDGFIRTSASIGSANVLGWMNAEDLDSVGGVSSAEDEAILEYVRVPATGVRSIALDRFGDAWIGGSLNSYQSKVDSVIGQNVNSTAVSPGCGGYGAVITPSGGTDRLWSALKTGSTLRMVLQAPYQPTCGAIDFGGDYGYGHGYGIAAHPTSGEAWQTLLDPWGIDEPPAGLVRWHADGTLYTNPDFSPKVYAHGSSYGAKGLTIDANGEIWVAHFQGPQGYGNTVGRVATDGQSFKTVNLAGASSNPHAPTGVSVGFDGKIWVANFGDDSDPATDTAMRIDPSLNGNDGAVDLEVELNQGWDVQTFPEKRARAYNYSDMTGFNNRIVNPTLKPRKGYWTVVQDGGVAGVHWSQVNWTPTTQPSGRLEVSVRASDDRLALSHSVFQTLLQSPGSVDLTGRFLEVRVAFVRVQESDQPQLDGLTLTFTQ